MASDTPAGHFVVSSPNVPRPADPEIVYIADTLRRIENNYGREGSGPGSRFAGRLLEDVQAEAVVRMVREQDAQLAEQRGAIWLEQVVSDDGVATYEVRAVADLIRARTTP